jgi:octanoyl-[GcvH]:protein N-octanoyltransferase
MTAASLSTAASAAWVRQPESLGAAGDLEYGISLLTAAKAGQLGPTLRVYRPRPTVAFGQRDTRLPGFEAAAAACRNLGFEPLVRRAGGRAAAYHEGCLVIDHIEPHPDAVAGARGRFGLFGDLLARGLTAAGVEAAVGEVPGEYCPGEFSVHGIDRSGSGRRIKLAGTAQRVVSGAWLFSTVVVISDSAPLRAVLTAAYAELGLDWEPATAGAADDLLPGLTPDGVEPALRREYAHYTALADGDFAVLPAPMAGARSQ